MAFPLKNYYDYELTIVDFFLSCLWDFYGKEKIMACFKFNRKS